MIDELKDLIMAILDNVEDINGEPTVKLQYIADELEEAKGCVCLITGEPDYFKE
jgi:NADPH-dependent 7-cyano-7-deazaguanine reductase QueF